MIYEGKYTLKASREKLWEFIIDPTQVSKCLPDLKSMESEGNDNFVAVVRVGVGPIRTDFKFKIQILNKNPVSSVQFNAAGSGSGSRITISTLVDLKDVSGGCELSYHAEVTVGGMMASLGQRVMNETAEKVVAGVFECIKNQVEQA
jgi:carbon monoxide dehydrogenase subunit G